MGSVTRLLLLLGSRHTTRPAHAGVGGHHMTVSPLFFIAYPQTRVPAPSVPGPYAGTAGAGPNPLSIALFNPASLNPRTRTQYLEIWTPECPLLTGRHCADNNAGAQRYPFFGSFSDIWRSRHSASSGYSIQVRSLIARWWSDGPRSEATKFTCTGWGRVLLRG